MLKLSPSFIALSTYAILSTITIKVASGDQQSNDVDQGDKDDWSKYQPKPENDPFTLSCLLFKDVGCDVECYAVTYAYEKLGGGSCDKNNVCVCNFATNPSLEGLFKKKFRATEDVLQYIQADSERSGLVYVALAKPFETGLQIKEKLKEYLQEPEYDKLEVIDNSPAMNMNPNRNEINLKSVDKYVDKILSKELKSAGKELEELDLETNLHQALNEYGSEVEKFNLLVFQIRMVQNKLLNLILDNYLTKHHIQEPSADQTVANEENGNNDDKEPNQGNSVDKNKEVNLPEVISNTVMNKLIKKMEKSGFKEWMNWIASFLPSCTSPTTKHDNDANSADFVFNGECFKTPPQVNRKLFKKSEINEVWMSKTFRLRYRKDKMDNMNFNWIKKPVLVSIMKTSESNVNQNWVFGTKVRINMSRTADGSIFQTWDFGTKTYEYYRINKTDGQYSDEKWSDKQADTESLDTYKSYIRSWCSDNQFLVKIDQCVIFK